MSKLFCPFTNGDCNYDCIMNNKCFDEGDPQGCMLKDAVDSIISFSKGISIANKNIDTQLKSISENTNSDHSYSYEIKEQLDNIQALLKINLQNNV